ncbi:MAG: hypothetical protein IT385_29710, partial [Deltaproteobacteria bacterium]|nr:hypothetical protein [Deltaproteobacteria bacterium]
MRSLFASSTLALLVACSAPGEGPTAPALDPSAEPGLALGALDGAARTIPYGGYVDFDGEPVNAGNVGFNFALFPCATPGTGAGGCSALWVAKGTWTNAATWTSGWPTGMEPLRLPIFSGRFAVELGGVGQAPLPEAAFESGAEVLYLGIQIEGRALGTLQKIAPAFKAVSAHEGDRLRVRSAVEIDDPSTGGSATLAADHGLVVGHSAAGLASDATLLRVENGAGETPLEVRADGTVLAGRYEGDGSRL